MNTGLKGKNILVTGGAGFVGSNLVRALSQKYNATVTVLDDLFTGSSENLQDVPHVFIQGTVEDKAIVNKHVKGKDIVFHLATRNIILSNMYPGEDFSVNVGGSYNVFEACVEHGVQRVIVASSSSVYGNPQQLPVSEGDSKNFLNFYSASKYAAEIYAKTFFEVYQLPITILRYSNIYGPYQTTANPYCGVIGKFFSAAMSNLPLRIYGDGHQTRDYTYIDDAVEATVAAAILPAAIGEEYNIGTGVQTSVLSVAKTILAITDSASIVQHLAQRDIDNIRHRCMDISKSVNHLQYHPRFTMEKGLRSTFSWFLESVAKFSAGVFAVTNLMGL